MHRPSFMFVAIVVAIVAAVPLGGCAAGGNDSSPSQPTISSTMTTADAMAKLRVGMTLEEFWLVEQNNPDWPRDMAASRDVSMYRMRDGNVWIRWTERSTGDIGKARIRELSTDPMVE